MSKPVATTAHKNPMREFIQEDLGDKIFDIIIWIIVFLAIVVCVYPFLYVLSVSISDGAAVNRGDIWLLPVGFDLSALKMVLGYDDLWTSYINTVIYTVMGTVCNVLFSILAAYPLSRRQFFLRKKLNFFLAFTMYFSGGLIPTYMVVTGLGLYNSRLAMVLPVLISAYNVMILRSAFEAIPEELFENANLEGANDFIMMGRIAVPLAKPTLAVLSLYYAVARYNDFFSALLYLGKTNLQPLTLFLRKVLLSSSPEILQSAGGMLAADAAAQSTLQIQYVCIVLAVIPIMCVCPFVQKYLVKGTMLGAVKG